MADLHGILAELGIETPYMHPEREVTQASEWTVDQEFIPVQGQSYEIAYGKILSNGEQKHVTKKVRIDGPTPADWFDLEEQKPLATGLQGFLVKGFRQIG